MEKISIWFVVLYSHNQYSRKLGSRDRIHGLIGMLRTIGIVQKLSSPLDPIEVTKYIEKSISN